MFPVAFTFWGQEIHWYGLLVAAGFLAGTTLAVRLGEKRGISGAKILDLAFYVLIAGIIGARVLYDIINWRVYWDACYSPASLGLVESDCLKLLRFWEGGLVFYGGFLLAFPVGIALVRYWKMPLATTADVSLAGLALGHAIGRLGCFTAGCCYGCPTDSPWGVVFPPDSGPGLYSLRYFGEIHATLGHAVPLHATQLYEALGEFGITLFLLGIFWIQRHPGQVALAWLGLYPLLRVAVEHFRGDHERGYLWSWTRELQFQGHTLVDRTGVSTSQVISLAVALLALGLLAYSFRRQAAAGSAGPHPVSAPPPSP